MNMYVRLALLILRSRWGARCGVWGPVTTRFRVRLTDLDPRFHMTNSKYLGIMDLGRIDMMLRSGTAREFHRRGWYAVVASQTITFRRSLKYRQRYELHTEVIGFDGPSIFLEQRFMVGDEIYAQGHVRARFIRKGGALTVSEVEEVTDTFPDFEYPAWLDEWAASCRITTRPEAIESPKDPSRLAS